MRDDLPSQQLPTINPGQIWVVEHDPASLSDAVATSAD